MANSRFLIPSLFCAAALLSGCASGTSGPPSMAEFDTTQPMVLADPVDPMEVERALDAGDLPRARSFLEQAGMALQNGPHWELLLAEYHLNSGGASMAKAEFADLTSDFEYGARASQGLGIALLLSGNRADAFDALTVAIERDPSLWRAWNALGILHDRDANFSKAVEAYDHALEAEQKRAEIHNNRGFSLLLSGEVEASIAALSKAMEMNPQLMIAKTNLRLALALKGEYVAALSGAARGEVRTLLNNAGFAAMVRGDLPNAEAFFVRAIEESPAYYSLAARNLELMETLKGGEAR